MYKLCIDIGTTSVKAILFGSALTVVAESAKEYSVSVRGGVFVEQDASDWWNLSVACVREVLRDAAVEPSSIRAIGVSGQTPSMLALDSSGEPLYPAIIWLDRRSAEEVSQLKDAIGQERLIQIGGKRMDSYHVPPKILWYRKNCPELFARTAMFVQSVGYINFHLTGRHSCNRSDAAISFLYDMKAGRWSREILDALQITEDQLPPIYDGDAVIGAVSAEAAAITGLARGTPVIAGYVDASAASLEAGNLPEGMALEATGTASTLRIAFNSVQYSPYLSTNVGLRLGTSSLFGEMSCTGASMRWLRDVLRGTGSDLSYADMSRMVEQSAPDPTNILFLPYLSGERSPIWDGDARGVFFGLDLSTTPAHMIRAVMEGTSYALRSNLEMAEKAGVKIRAIRSVGGCTRSDIWLKIKASIIKVPIEVPDVSIGAPAGIAMLTAACTGEYESVEAAMESCVKVKKTVYPDPEWAACYDQIYPLFRELYARNKTMFENLSKIKYKRRDTV